MESIILFGTGKYFKHKEDILDKYSVKFLLDNKIEQCTEEINEYRGILMINPLNLEPDSKENIPDDYEFYTDVEATCGTGDLSK